MTEHIMQFFAYAHLPPDLQDVSKPFADIAAHVEHSLPRNPERTVALRKLLEAKDAAVRAKLAVPDAVAVARENAVRHEWSGPARPKGGGGPAPATAPAEIPSPQESAPDPTPAPWK